MNKRWVCCIMKIQSVAKLRCGLSDTSPSRYGFRLRHSGLRSRRHPLAKATSARSPFRLRLVSSVARDR